MADYIKVMPAGQIQYSLEEFLKPGNKTRPEFVGPNFYQCLPMLAANTFGWTLYNPFEFTVMWTGGQDRPDVIVECEHPWWAYSWFGYGTFSIFPQFVVETSPGIDLMVGPVPNHFKHLVLTFGGLIETDWLKSSFTLNFRLMMPMVKVTYPVGEPLVQFFPVQRHFIEDFEAEIVTSGEAYDRRMAQLAEWRPRREHLNKTNGQPDLDYLHGIDVDGSSFEDHKTTFKPQPFTHHSEE